VTVAAIDALRKLRDPGSVEVLALYAGNRGPDIRQHALEALGVFADGRVVPVLMDRLGDAVADVRGAAAQALATRGEKAATPRMLALLRRNDAAVAGPLGTLIPVSARSEITELRGGISDDNLATTLGELLKRRDVPESARLEIVKTLSGIPAAASTTALIEYVGTLPARDRRASRSVAQKTIDERGKRP
jgi:HEAT repeat protein